MIGTLICRSCESAVEVSERDVTRFEVQSIFRCPKCKTDLSQGMAEMIGRAPITGAAAEMEELFEGLPIGGSLEEAASRLRPKPAEPGSEAGVVPAEPDHAETPKSPGTSDPPRASDALTPSAGAAVAATVGVASTATASTSTADSAPGAAMRAPALPEEPRDEVTQRKVNPPVPLPAPRTSIAGIGRSGTGPIGIGALGFRISGPRPIVRPPLTGRLAAATRPPDEALVKTAILRETVRLPGPPPLAPNPTGGTLPVAEPAPRAPSRNRVLLAAAAAAVILVGWLVANRTGTRTDGPRAARSPIDTPRGPVPTPDSGAVAAGGGPATATGGATPAVVGGANGAASTGPLRVERDAVTAVAPPTPPFRPRPAPTPAVRETSPRAPDPVDAATATAHSPEEWKEFETEVGLLALKGDFDAAYERLIQGLKQNFDKEKVRYDLFRYAKRAKGTNLAERKSRAKEYLKRHRGEDPDHTKEAEAFLEEHADATGAGR